MRDPELMGDPVDDYLRGAVVLAGVAVTEDELRLLRLFHDAMAPRLQALLRSDVMETAIEYDLDPSRAPKS